MRTKYKLRLASASLPILALIGFAPAAAFARGSDGTNDGVTTTSSPAPSPSVSPASTTENESHSGSGSTSTSSHTSTTIKSETNDDTTQTSVGHTEIEQESSSNSVSHEDSLRSRALQLLDDKRQNKPARSQAEQQKACLKDQADINSKLARLSTRAQAHLTSFNSVFSKVQAYQTSHQLAVNNYAALEADTTTKQAAATAAVAALKSVSVTINCSAPDPANSIATVQTASADAKTSLQAYRASLLTLVNALLAVAQPSPSSSPNTQGN